MEQKKKPDLNRISTVIVTIFCIVMSAVLVFIMVKDIGATLKKKENKDGYSDMQTEAEITESETASQTDFEYDPSPELREYYEEIGTILNIEKASESDKLYSDDAIMEPLISEESFFIGYDSESDAFFTVEPREDNDEMLFIQINKIDAESLQLLTPEKIAELQSAE